jgi:PAS domain S-box-containing protein
MARGGWVDTIAARTVTAQAALPMPAPASPARLWPALAAAVLAPLLLFGGSAWLGWQAAWRNAEAELSRTAETAAEYARRVLEAQLLRIGRTNDLLAGMPDAEIRAREAELHLALRRIAAEREPAEREAFYIFVYDRHAAPLVSSNLLPVPPPAPELAAREFNTALRGPGAPWVHVNQLVTGNTTGRPFFTVSGRREDGGNGLPPGAYDGVVNASVYADTTAAALRNLASSPGDVITLLRMDGALLARSSDLARVPAQGLRLPAGSPILETMAAGADRAIRHGPSGLDGVARVSAARRVGGGWPVYVFAGRERAAVVATWARAMAPQAALALGSAMLLSMLALAVARRQRALETANARLEQRVEARTRAWRDSEARLRRAQDAAGAVAFEVGPDGRMVQGQDGFRALYGLTPDQEPDFAAFLRAVHPADRARLDAAHRALAMAGGSFRDEFRIVLPDGTRRWILASGEALPGTPGAGFPGRIAGVSIDITDRRRAEDALAERERLLRLAQQAADAVSWSWETDTDRMEWSPEAAKVLGRTDAEADGIADYAGFIAMIHPADRAAVEAAIRTALADGAMAIEFRILRPLLDGGREERWLLSRARLFHGEGAASARLIGIALDITERRRSAERFDAATMAMEGCVYEWDIPRGVVQRTQGIEQMLGEPIPDGAEAWTSRMPPEDRARIQAEFGATFADAGRDRYALEYRVRRADGGWAWVLDRGRITRDPASGAAIRAVGGVVDITARRLAEERQALLLREVDHRAKNALAVVKAAVRLTPRDDAGTFAAAIESRIDALARAQALLAETSWAGAGLRTMLQAALAPFVEAGSDRLALEGPELSLASIATQPLSMAVHELATNATKYGALSAPGGRLSLRWWVQDGMLRLDWQESGGPALPGQPARRGFGSRVVEATLQRQLGGLVTWDWAETGLRVRIALPAGRVLAAGFDRTA